MTLTGAGASRSCWGLVDTRLSLTKSKCLSSSQTLARLQSTHLSFTSTLMFFIRHLNVCRRETPAPMLSKKAAIATVENVDFGVGQSRIVFRVGCSIFRTDKSGH